VQPESAADEFPRVMTLLSLSPTMGTEVAMFARLLALFTLLPLVELYILIKIGASLGALTTVLIVVGTGVLGAALARTQGFAVWRRIQMEMNMGRFPADDMLDGLLIFFAGAVLLTPGIITDAMGFFVLIPPTRALIRRWVKRRLRRMGETGSVTFGGFIR
jgi:UPF0716 protein FxsA